MSGDSWLIPAILIVAAVVTPPDVISQLALAIPMVLLYEFGIWCAQLFIKHTQAPDSEPEAKADGSAVAAIHAADSAVELWVVPTDEELLIARDTFRVIAGVEPT